MPQNGGGDGAGIERSFGTLRQSRGLARETRADSTVCGRAGGRGGRKREDAGEVGSGSAVCLPAGAASFEVGISNCALALAVGELRAGFGCRVLYVPGGYILDGTD